jgi:hypothetical protein
VYSILQYTTHQPEKTKKQTGLSGHAPRRSEEDQTDGNDWMKGQVHKTRFPFFDDG